MVCAAWLLLCATSAQIVRCTGTRKAAFCPAPLGCARRVRVCERGVAAVEGRSGTDGHGLHQACQMPWDWYNKTLQASPILVKMTTTASLGSLSDIIAQILEGGPFAPSRHCAIILVNALYIAPLVSFFFDTNERLVGGKLNMPADTWRGTFMRLAIDQLVYSPLFILGFFWVYGLTEALLSYHFWSGGAVDYGLIRKHVSAEYGSMLVSNWQVWIVPQLINFRFVPPIFRLPFSSLIALIWGVVQSIIANR